MGLLSDFVVADASEAAAVATTDRSTWPMLESKGFTTLEVAHLHFLITGADPDAPAVPREVVRNPFTKRDQVVGALSKYCDFECLVDEESSWVHALPDSLVAEIADAGDLVGLAKKWAECEELQGAEPRILHDVLVSLQRLARTARDSRKRLLLWTSL